MIPSGGGGELATVAPTLRRPLAAHLGHVLATEDEQAALGGSAAAWTGSSSPRVLTDAGCRVHRLAW